MRSRFLLAVTLALAAVPAAGARMRMPLRCCLELDLPDVPPGPVCAQLKSRRPRLACRLLGGRAMGHGDCSRALCVAGH